MNVLVGYESKGGRTKRAAEAIADAAAAEGADVTIRPIASISKMDVAAADVVFLGSWVKGFLIIDVGPVPKALKAIDAFDSLDGKRAAAFCTYALHPARTLDTISAHLRARGATVVGERAFHRSDPAEGAGAFARDVLSTVPSEP